MAAPSHSPGSSKRGGPSKGLLIFLLAIAVGFSFAKRFPFGGESEAPPPRLVSHSQVQKILEAAEIDTLWVVNGKELRGVWRDSTGAESRFRSGYPLGTINETLKSAEKVGAEIVFEEPTGRRWHEIAQILVTLLLAGVFIFWIVSMSRFGDKEQDSEVLSTTTFEDVAGTDEAIQDLRQVVRFLRDPKAYTEMGARMPKGVLLVGPPGTGKTLLARAVAGEAGVPFFAVGGSEFTGPLVALGVRRVRQMFKKVRKKGGILFIDELESLGGKRGRNRGHNEDDRTLNQLLVEMDGFRQDQPVVIIAATNRPEMLDDALLRPGRFDRQVQVGLPTPAGREAILKVQARVKGIQLSEGVDLGRLARLSPGLSGAELENLLNEAAIEAVDDSAEEVQWHHVERARDRVLMGRRREGFVVTPAELEMVAYHEAGHALGGVVACPQDGLHKVTIQPRGRAMGVAHFAPSDDRHLASRRYLFGMLVKALGGRAAEESLYGPDRVTSGAASDLEQANRIARRMVCSFGMGERTGFLIMGQGQSEVGLDARADMDRDVQDLLDSAYHEARSLCRRYSAALDALVEVLMEKEEVAGEEVVALFAEHGVPVPEEIERPVRGGGDETGDPVAASDEEVDEPARGDG